MSAISNIELRIHVNEYGGVSGKTVIYHRRNADGTTDVVERIWRCFAKATESRDFVGSRIEKPTVSQLNNPAIPIGRIIQWNLISPKALSTMVQNKTPANMGLIEFINYCEINRKSTAPANHDFQGGVVRQERYVAPQPPPLPLQSQVNSLSLQVKQLSEQLAKQQQKNTNLTIVNTQQRTEIAKICQEVAKLNQILASLN